MYFTLLKLFSQELIQRSIMLIHIHFRYILPEEVGDKIKSAKTPVDRKVNQICLLIHKTRRVDPAYFQ